MKILYTGTHLAFFIAFIIPLSILNCRTHKPFASDFSVRGLQEKTLGTERVYDARISVVQEALLNTFIHFGNRVNVEGALVDDAYMGRFSYLISQNVRTQVQLYEVDLHKPMVLRATYPTYTLSLLKIKENIHRVYMWVETFSASESEAVPKTRVRMLIDEEPPQKKYQISPRGAKYTVNEFLNYVETYISKVSSINMCFRP